MHGFWLALALLVAVLCLVTTASAATYTVTNTADTGAGSLRQAVTEAAAQSGADTIVFAPAMSGQTITLAGAITVNDANGVTIDATALAGGLTISGNNATRIFSQSNASSRLTLRGLSLTGGNNDNNGGAISNSGTLTLTQCSISGNSARYAGAIDNASGTLTMTQCTLSGNSARGSDSGAIYIGNNCTVALTQCTFTQNSAIGYGGAIYASSGSALSLVQCIFVGNLAANSWSGGAIYNGRAEVTLTECTLSANSAYSGGAIVNDVGTMSLTRCTLSGNSATGGTGGAILNASGTLTLTLTQCTLFGNSTNGYGGAICNGGSSILMLVHCTLSGNTAGNSGGGIYNSSFGTLTMTNSIVAGNAANTGVDIHYAGGTIIGTGVNLIGNNDTASAVFPAGTPNGNGNYVGTNTSLLDPRLAPLGNYGGPTQTMALLPGSLARNRATILTPAIVADQRGRPINNGPDIGAFENQFGVRNRPLLIPFDALSGSVICNLETDGEVSASSDNTAVIPNAGITLSGTGLSRTTTITPAGQIGRATLTLTQLSSGETDRFEVYVLPKDYVASSINDIQDKMINEDAGTLVIPFTVTDGASVFGLTVNATSSNPTLVPNGSIILAGTGASRSLSVTPVADQYGATTITVTVTDGATTARDTFLLTVNSVNDAPSFTKGADQLKSSDVAGMQIVSNWATNVIPGPPEESNQVLSFIVDNDNHALFTVQPAVSSIGTLTYTPVTGAAGTAHVSVRLQDNGGITNGGINTSAVQTFTITLVASGTLNVVTSTADSGPGTLRQILSTASAQTGASVITFASGLSGQTIKLASPITVNAANGVTIDATGLPGGLTISGNNATRIFTQSGISSRLILRGISLINGRDRDAGGAINNNGTLTLTQCSLSGHSAFGPGGAIYNAGTLTLTQCSISGNSTISAHGGAIQNTSGTNTITLTHCTLSGNSTGDGYGGGAISNSSGNLKLTHCTLSGNASSNGGAIFNTNIGTLTLTNSIVAGNTANNGPDIYITGGNISRGGVNIIGNNSTATASFPAGTPNVHGNYVGTPFSPLNPQLAPLGNYGASTQTMALLPSSLARDRAAILVPSVTADQRGFPIVGTPDIGAYEAGTTNTFALWSLENAGAGLGFGSDTDGDGLPDGLEYATRSSLTAKDVNPLIGPLAVDGPAIQFSFPYRAGANDLRYIVQRSTDLATWTEIYRYDMSKGVVTKKGVATDENSATQIITLVDPATSYANFWRVLVELVP